MNPTTNQYSTAGIITLSVRLVIGWTYFSAFWRRLILENKLIPEEAGYIGEKFNHFLPNALGIKPLIEHLVSNPDQLQTAMIAFTIIEAIVGLFMMLGLFTRLMSVGVFSLAMGILLGSGWLGTTCLDEWQIGVLGIASGFILYLSGGGSVSLDHYLSQKSYAFTHKKWFSLLGSGALPIANLKKVSVTGAIFLLGMTLFTNQYFHGGVYGKLHNKSVKPKVEISNASIQQNELEFQVFRVEGADVYGSFLIGIEVLNNNMEVVQKWSMEDLANLQSEQIHNHYVSKVKPGKYSLILPLGAKADLTLPLNDSIVPTEIKTLKLIDISGAEWQIKLSQ